MKLHSLPRRRNANFLGLENTKPVLHCNGAMASNFSVKNLIILALAFVLSVQGTQGGITCEHLDQETCTFAVSSSGKRCVLEKQVKRSGEEAYTCRTSEILADKLKDWVETDDCVKACGLDRTTLGISSDSLLESRFAQQLCSYECYESCPNIADLYFNLAAGEGVFLPKLCEAQRANPRRGMSEILRSSGHVAPGPLQPVRLTAAPIVAPAQAPQPVRLTAAPIVAPAQAPC